MCRTDVHVQSKWLEDAREEISAGLRTSSDAWLKDLSLRWGCRLAMLVADFGVRVMLHHDGFGMEIAFDSAGSSSSQLAHAASVKLPKLEEIAVAIAEANAFIEGDPHADQCIETILAWRQMIDAVRDMTRHAADSYVSRTCRPLLRQFMELAACASAGRPFELSRDGDYEEAWREFEHFCIDSSARPATAWGRKYRKAQWIEIRQPARYARQEKERETAFNLPAPRHTMIVESPLS